MNQKIPEILTNKYRTKLILCELNSLGNTFEGKYKFGGGQIL